MEFSVAVAGLRRKVDGLRLSGYSVMALVVILSACREPSERLHPLPGALPHEKMIVEMDELPKELEGLALAIRNAPRVLTVGTLDGPAETRFGTIDDIEVDSAGRIFVLDAQNKEIRIFGADGQFLRSIGRAGSGPGELRNPVALMWAGKDSLLVADRTNGIAIYSTSRLDSVFLLDTWRTAFVPEDGCSISSLIYLRGHDTSNTLVHGYDAQGRRLHDFMTGYGNGLESAFIAGQASDGLIACSPSSGMVVAAFDYFPVLYGFPAGRNDPAWAVSLPDPEQVEIRESINEQGRPTVSVGQDGDHTYQITALPGGVFLVQVIRIQAAAPGAEGRETSGTARNYLVSEGSGRGTYLGDSLPEVMAADEKRFYGAWGTAEEPWYRLVVHQYRPDSAGT